MTRRFPAESAIPVAQALLSPQGFRVGKQQPTFLRWLTHHNWAKAVTTIHIENRYVLTPSGQTLLPEFMASEFGGNWLNVSTTTTSRERFLADHLTNQLPEFIHSHVATAVWGEHSKKSVKPPEGLSERNCDIIQLRTSSKVELIFSSGKMTSRKINCTKEMAFSDAVILNEKMLSSLNRIKSEGKLSLITVENAGAWQHMPLPEGLVVIHVQGNNQKLFRQLVTYFPDASWSHFGNLDPYGIQLAQNMALGIHRKLTLFIPNWWYEYIKYYQVPLSDENRKKQWAFLPILLSREYPILNRLKTEQTWLEQNAIMLDHRLENTLTSWIRD